MSTIPIAAVALLLLACSDATGSTAPTVAPVATTAAGSKGIGDPCVGSDGWQRQELSAPAGDGAAPVFVPANGTPDQAPTGVGYCLTSGPGYPGGYFTANCNTDADCPNGSFCDGANPACPKVSDCRGECRKPCSNDRDCTAPMTCSGGAAPRSFCYDNVGGQTRF